MRLFPVIFPLFVVATAACGPKRVSSGVPKETYRVIPVCVVNDAEDPVDEKVIDKALDQAFWQYLYKVNIDFEIDAQTIAPLVESAWPFDQAVALRGICPRSSEVRIVFSNRKADAQDVSMTETDETHQMAGGGHPYYGHIIVYSAEERWAARNAAGTPALAGTLTHEIGHLFGLEHDPDPASFMHASSNRSFGRWKTETVAVLRKNKWKRWWPRA